MSKRGLCLYASSMDNDWPSLVALNPVAIVAMDPYHLPRALGESCYWLWRPWVPGTMRDWTPRKWIERVRAEWVQKGEHPFHGIQFLNEPNLAMESGYPDGSREAADATVAWGLAVIDLIRETWGDVDVHSPPLSPDVPGYLDFYHWLEPLVDACDCLNVHAYLNKPLSYALVHNLYAAMPLVISECGDCQGGTAEYGRQMLVWYAALPDYVAWATLFVYQGTDGQFPQWELHGTPAERVLIGGMAALEAR